MTLRYILEVNRKRIEDPTAFAEAAALAVRRTFARPDAGRIDIAASLSEGPYAVSVNMAGSSAVLMNVSAYIARSGRWTAVRSWRTAIQDAETADLILHCIAVLASGGGRVGPALRRYPTPLQFVAVTYGEHHADAVLFGVDLPDWTVWGSA